MDWMTVYQSYSAVFKKDAAVVLEHLEKMRYEVCGRGGGVVRRKIGNCLLFKSAGDDGRSRGDFGGRRHIQKKKT